MDHRYSKIVNREKKQVEMLLYGIIGDDFEEGEVNGNYFAQELRWLGTEYDEITIRINSWGGDLDMGLSIISEIRASRAYIITKVDGVAASMSGVIAVSGDRSKINDYARLMLHLAYYIDQDGNKIDELSPKAQKSLDQMNGILTDILTRKGKSKEDITAILENETWYDAGQAVSEGFIDEMVDTTQKSLAALLPGKLVAAQMKEVQLSINNNQKSMEKIAAKFGLGKDATEDQVLAKIQEKESEATAKAVAQLIAMGRAIGTVTDENKDKVERLAKADFDLAAEMYLAVKQDATVKEAGKGVLIADLVNKGGKTATTVTAEKKFEELTEAEADDLRKHNRVQYVALYKTRYGFEPEIEE